MTKVTIKVDATADAYGPEEAAKLLGKGIATIWRWIRSDKILVVRIGGRTLIPKQEIDRLQKELSSPAN
jgi:excisionase family DNA binding protein